MCQVRLRLKGLKGTVCCHTAFPPKGCPQEAVMLTEVTKAPTTLTPKPTDTQRPQTRVCICLSSFFKFGLKRHPQKHQNLGHWHPEAHSLAPYHHPLWPLLMDFIISQKGLKFRSNFLSGHENLCGNEKSGALKRGGFLNFIPLGYVTARKTEIGKSSFHKLPDPRRSQGIVSQ